jgi:hypothetical protein
MPLRISAQGFDCDCNVGQKFVAESGSLSLVPFSGFS